MFQGSWAKLSIKFMNKRAGSSDKSPWPAVFGDPWSYIPLSVPSHQFFFTGSFSSTFLLNLCCHWDSSQAETRLDPPSGPHDIPGTFLFASWHCALCHPHILAQLISDCIFTPGCYDHIILRKCSGKANLCSSAAVPLHMVLSLTLCKYCCRGLRFK